MANDRLPKMGDNQVASVGKVALGMMAVGLSAGLALIAGAKKFGDTFFAPSDEDEEEEK